VGCSGGDDILIEDGGSLEDVGVGTDGRASTPDGATVPVDAARPEHDGAADGSVDEDAATSTDATADRDEPSDARPTADAADAAPPVATDAGAPDATSADAGSPTVDASPGDASVRDAASVDSSMPVDASVPPDASVVDASSPPPGDAGPADAGQDATLPPPPPPVDAGAPDAELPCVIPAAAYTMADPVVDVGPAETVPFGDEVRLISLKANAIVYDPHSRHLFATTPSSVGAQGNSIVTIDPASASILAVTFIGSEPTRLAVSRDGQFLYTNLRGANAVRRFDIASSTASIQFTLGDDPNGTPNNAIDLQVLPHSPHAVLVSAPYSTYSSSGLLTVFDDGVARRLSATPSTYPSYYGPAFLVTSNSDSLAFGMDAYSNGLVELCIDARGVQPGTFHTGFASNVTQLAYSSPSVYTSSGNVFNVATATFLGTFSLPPSSYYVASGVAVDTPANRAYFLSSASYNAPGLTAFDESHFTPTGSIAAPPLPASTTSAASQLVRWGRYGLAYITGDGQIALVRSPIVAQQ
jgi:hypothetical protein